MAALVGGHVRQALVLWLEHAVDADCGYGTLVKEAAHGHLNMEYSMNSLKNINIILKFRNKYEIVWMYTRSRSYIHQEA